MHTCTDSSMEGLSESSVECIIATCPALVTVQKALDTHSGKHSAALQLLREDHLFTYPLLAVPRYSLIQLSEVFQRGVNEIAKVSKEDFNLGSLH